MAEKEKYIETENDHQKGSVGSMAGSTSSVWL